MSERGKKQTEKEENEGKEGRRRKKCGTQSWLSVNSEQNQGNYMFSRFLLYTCWAFSSIYALSTLVHPALSPINLKWKVWISRLILPLIPAVTVEGTGIKWKPESKIREFIFLHLHADGSSDSLHSANIQNHYKEIWIICIWMHQLQNKFQDPRSNKCHSCTKLYAYLWSVNRMNYSSLCSEQQVHSSKFNTARVWGEGTMRRRELSKSVSEN